MAAMIDEMNLGRYSQIGGVLAAFGLLFSQMATTAGAQVHTYAAAGLRWHQPGHLAGELPFARGDLSAITALRFHDRDAWWQLGLGYAWDAGEENGASKARVLTPQLHLCMRGHVVVLGLGALISHVDGAPRESGWSPVYYEWFAGAEVPLGRLGICLVATHPYRNWGDALDATRNTLNYVAALSWRF